MTLWRLPRSARRSPAVSPSSPPPAPSPRCRPAKRGSLQPSYRTWPSSHCPRPEVQHPVGLNHRHPPRGGVRLGLPGGGGGVLLSVGRPQLDQHFGRLATHRIASASSPDG